jgi:hypothetical protein
MYGWSESHSTTAKESHLKHLLQAARSEIIELRRRNEILAAQVAVVEVFAAACGLRGGQQRASIDIAWELDRKIEELTIEEESHQKETAGAA